MARVVAAAMKLQDATLIVNGTATKNKLKALVKDELHNKIDK